MNPGESEDKTIFVYDGNHTTLQLENTGTSDVVASDLTHRYLYGTAVDQILADEQVTSLSTPGDVLTPLADHLGSVRDVLDANSTVRIHRAYNAFGETTSQDLFNAAGTLIQPTDPGALSHLLGFTGRPFDVDSFLNWHLNRWYDTFVAKWASEDPIGFVAGDLNLYRYVGNEPLGHVDPDGKKVRMIDVLSTNIQGARWSIKMNEQDNKSIKRALRIVDMITDEQFERAKKDGSVKFNGEKFDGDRPEYRARIRREWVSHTIEQNSGGFAGAYKALEAAARHGKYDYDVAALLVHGLWDPQANKPVGKMTFNGQYVADAIVNRGIAALRVSYPKGRIEILSCFNNPQGLQEDGAISPARLIGHTGIYTSGGKLVQFRPYMCDIDFLPARFEIFVIGK